MRKHFRSGVALLLSLMLVFQLCDGVIAYAAEDPTADIVLTTPEDLKDGSWFFKPWNADTVTDYKTGRSFAFADGVLWPLKPTLPTPYHSLYRQPVSIPRAGVPAFIANELPALGAKMPIAFEEGLSADCFTVRPGKPKFHLSVSGTLDALSVRLEALYGAKRVVAVSPEAPGAVAEPDDDDIPIAIGY